MPSWHFKFKWWREAGAASWACNSASTLRRVPMLGLMYCCHCLKLSIILSLSLCFLSEEQDNRECVSRGDMLCGNMSEHVQAQGSCPRRPAHTCACREQSRCCGAKCQGLIAEVNCSRSSRISSTTPEAQERGGVLLGVALGSRTGTSYAHAASFIRKLLQIKSTPMLLQLLW